MNVSWISLHRPDVLARGMWDQTIVERTLDATGYDPSHMEQFGGDVVIIGGRHHADPDDFDRIQERILRQDAVMVVVTSDEEMVFPWWELTHPNMRLWVQTPRRWHDRTFGVGPSPHAWDGYYTANRNDYYFSGQITHQARHDAAAFLRQLPGATDSLYTTSGFTQGISPSEYVKRLGEAKIAPSPSGPVTPDTFRLYEALENGCLPVVDDNPPHGETGYWDRLYGPVPFPVVRWSELSRDKWQGWVDGWPANANKTSSWWQAEKWDFARRWRTDLAELFGLRSRHNFTVIIPTSPTPNNPDTFHIDETVTSIRERTDAPILIMADGVRSEQEHLRSAYEAYLHEIIWKATHDWDATVIREPAHLHQARFTRLTLREVDTPAILFVEHDTPLTGTIPMFKLADVVASSSLNIVRLHHEVGIHPEHQHLVEGSIRFDGVDFVRTTQWSQRPHFANTDYYRMILDGYFAADARTMIEDRMHGVVQSTPWGQHRIGIYAPDKNDMKRSTHLDARGTEPKFEDTFRW